MIRKNLFFGESHEALFANKIYMYVKSRKWFTYSDVMADYLMLKSAKDLKNPISKCDHVKELSKAFMDIREAIGKDNFKTEGNNRNKRFLYIGEDDDPLADMRNARAINDLNRYWQFCQDSAGFFPPAWLDYFFKNSRDLLTMRSKKKKGDQVLSASLDRMLTNIELLPMLYDHIINKQVLQIHYKPYGENEEVIIFHPQYLKEFNGRWHLFGHAEGRLPENGYNIPLDRIVGQPEKLVKEYIAAPKEFYAEFFKNIVGVSHFKGAPSGEIRIRAHNYKIYMLTKTKKMHHSQDVIVPFGHHEDGCYGDFVLNVEVNNELIGRILQMGEGLEVVSPDNVRKIFAERICKMADLYK